MSDTEAPSSGTSGDVLGDGSCWCGGRGICSACPPCKTPAPPTPTLSEFAAYIQHSVIDGGSILPPPCATCDGRGTVTEGYRDEYGSLVEQSTSECPACHGSGDA